MRSRILPSLALIALLIASTATLGIAAEKKLPSFSVKDLKGKPHRSEAGHASVDPGRTDVGLAPSLGGSWQARRSEHHASRQ